MPVVQVAALIGRPVLGVLYRAGELGVRHVHKPEEWSEEEAARALVLAHEGLRYLAII